jgi:hypothetical protein
MNELIRYCSPHSVPRIILGPDIGRRASDRATCYVIMNSEYGFMHSSENVFSPEELYPFSFN